MRPDTEPFGEALGQRETANRHSANGRFTRLAGLARTVIDDLDAGARTLTTQPYHLPHR